MAFFAHNFFSPSVTFILDQVTGLLDRGVDVQVFTGPLNPGDIPHESFARYDLHKRVHLWPSGRELLESTMNYLRGCAKTHQPPPIRALLPYRNGRIRRDLVSRALPLLMQAPFDVAVAHFGNLASTVQDFEPPLEAGKRTFTRASSP